ncbi:flavin reductase [Spiractinospora alimapuensis]|uniref:flavin reductase family protein n=1 Tax=Spiractinospora alimapuensis TaxID=2820884 RepID=UPI001F2926EF|nr:flavin reductase family protein [Spiractinospora alimapuensis]QVQ55100.1 flavin reductase [Spiractinospora alimapuensis]
MSVFAAGVTVVTVADGRDDVGSTVSAFASISVDPAIVMVSLTEDSYLTETVDRQGVFAVSLLGWEHRAVAGRFSAEGRPSARLLLANEPHHRAPVSGALVLDTALAALDCRVRERTLAGDHVVYLADVTELVEVSGPRGERSAPLVRYQGRYRTLATGTR